MKEVKLKEIIKDLKLKVEVMPEGADENITVKTMEINKPGLQLAGYFDYFIYERIQIIGKTEYTFFGSSDKKTRNEVLNKLFSYDIPAIIVTRDLGLKDDFREIAKKHDMVVLSTDKSTTKFVNTISNYLERKLAPMFTIHGVLVDVFGVGVLITGESSVGKSETALELIKRGHRLVADDAVEITNVDGDLLMGRAPEILRYFLEIRGIGIIDIKSLFGVGAVKPTMNIDLVVNLEKWNEEKYYDRLGLDKEYQNILGVEIEKMIMPVKPGRNTASLLEVAAMNIRQKNMGYDAALEFTNKISKKATETT